MDKSLIGELTERVETLERENRRWKRGGGFVLIASLVVVIGGAERADDPKVVEADQFIVRDKDGKERVRLGLASDGSPILFLRGKDGHNRVMLQAGDVDDCGKLILFGSGQEDGISVVLNGSLQAVNTPYLFMRHDEKRRINLNVNNAPGQF